MARKRKEEKIRTRFRSKLSPIPLQTRREDGPYHRGAMFVEGIPISTRTAFKAACAMQGISMRDAIILQMRAFVEKAKL